MRKSAGLGKSCKRNKKGKKERVLRKRSRLTTRHHSKTAKRENKQPLRRKSEKYAKTNQPKS